MHKKPKDFKNKPAANPGIITVRQVGSICTVDPGIVHIGDKMTFLQWDNQTNGDIDIFLTDPNLGSVVSAAKPGKPVQLNPQNPGNDETFYEYFVYCHATGNFAVAGSEPEMIVP